MTAAVRVVFGKTRKTIHITYESNASLTEIISQ